MRTRHGTYPLLFALGLAAVLIASVAGPAGGADVRVAGVGFSFAGRELRLEARLAPGLPPEVRERCGSGLPTTAVWEVRLYGHRDVWWDGLKDERRYEVTASYRPVSSDWVVERRLDGKLLETRTVPALEEAASALSGVKDLPVFTMGDHLIGKPLQLRVRCTYGNDLALGVIPTRVATPWARSTLFDWTGERP